MKKLEIKYKDYILNQEQLSNLFCEFFGVELCSTIGDSDTVEYRFEDNEFYDQALIALKPFKIVK